MLINLSKILSKEKETDKREVPVEMTEFVSKMGSFPIVSKTAVLLSITNKGNKVLLVEGKGEISASIPCGRCLKDVVCQIPLNFEREIDMKLTEEERIEKLDENNYISGGNLDMEQLVYNEILINWPLRVLCRDDCRGICSHCGKNLNEGPCECETDDLDPRMAAISDIFSKFKEV